MVYACPKSLHPSPDGEFVLEEAIRSVTLGNAQMTTPLGTDKTQRFVRSYIAKVPTRCSGLAWLKDRFMQRWLPYLHVPESVSKQVVKDVAAD